MLGGGLAGCVGMLLVAYWLWQKDSHALSVVCLVLAVAGVVNQLIW
jgi:multidrug transporter EmrE-like cation transporter